MAGKHVNTDLIPIWIHQPAIASIYIPEHYLEWNYRTPGWVRTDVT